MNPDKYQQAWKAESAQTQITFDTDLLSKEVQRSHKAFQSMILFRDIFETSTSLLLIPIWIAIGIYLSLPWTWYLTVPALMWVAGFMLVDRKRHPQRPSEPGQPLVFYVKESLKQVEHQIWLLRNVSWWYLLPFCISMMAFFLHEASRNPSRLEFLLTAGGLTLFVMVIYGAVYWFNKYTVRKKLEPRRRDLMKLVASLEDDTNHDDSDDVIDLVSALVDPSKNAGLSLTWQGWAANWNSIIPSWRAAAAVILPTLIGALCGGWFPIPEMGPVFFQSVVAAVIPFEIALGWVWWRSHKKKKQLAELTNDSNATTSRIELGIARDESGPVLPNAPAIAIIILTLIVGFLAFAAIYVCIVDMKKRSQDTVVVIDQSDLADPSDVTPDRLVGRYQLAPDFIFDVRQVDDRILVGITNQQTQEVFADSPVRWSYRSVEATLEFHLRTAGPAYAVTLHQNGLAQRAKRIQD